MVRNCFTFAMTNKLVVIIKSLEVPKIKKMLLFEMKFLVPNYSCLQNPWLWGLPPQDPRSLCPLSSTEFVNPPPRTKFLGMPLLNGNAGGNMGQGRHWTCRGIWFFSRRINIGFSRNLLLGVSCSLSETFACYILPFVTFHNEWYSEIAWLSYRLAQFVGTNTADTTRQNNKMPSLGYSPLFVCYVTFVNGCDRVTSNWRLRKL